MQHVPDCHVFGWLSTNCAQINRREYWSLQQWGVQRPQKKPQQSNPYLQIWQLRMNIATEKLYLLQWVQGRDLASHTPHSPSDQH